MDESFLDYLKRVTDEIREIQKNSAAESKARIAESEARAAESKARAAESKARMDRFGEWLAKSSAEFDQRIRENNEQIRKSREDFDRDLKKSREKFDRDIRKSREEFNKSMAEVNRNLGGIGNTQGEIAEDLFRRNAHAALNNYGIHIDQVHHNLRSTGRREYDIVAVNAEQAVVIEIKTKLKARDVEKFLQTQLPQFKSAFPEFRDYAVYGGMGALVISKEQELELCGLGLFVFTQGEDGIARVRKPANPIIL